MSDHTHPFDDHAHDALGAPPLSEAGAARRDAMLATLIPHIAPAARRRRRRRAATSAAGAAAVVLALAATALILVQPNAPTSPLAPGPIVQNGADRAAPVTDAPPPAPRTTIALVRTDHAILTRLAAPSPAAAPGAGDSLAAQLTLIQIVNDEQLITALAEAGRPSGIARSQGRVWLTADIGATRPGAL